MARTSVGAVCVDTVPMAAHTRLVHTLVPVPARVRLNVQVVAFLYSYVMVYAGHTFHDL